MQHAMLASCGSCQLLVQEGDVGANAMIRIRGLADTRSISSGFLPCAAALACTNPEEVTCCDVILDSRFPSMFECQSTVDVIKTS